MGFGVFGTFACLVTEEAFVWIIRIASVKRIIRAEENIDKPHGVSIASPLKSCHKSYNVILLFYDRKK